jgi:hypothetical protein
VREIALREGYAAVDAARFASYGTMLLSAGTILGCLVLPPIAEALGRRVTLGLYFLIMLFSITVGFGYVFYLASNALPWFMTMLFVLGIGGANFAMYTLWLPEQYPTDCRASAFAFATSVGRFVGAGITFLVGSGVQAYGTVGTPVAFTAIAFAIGLLLLPFGEGNQGEAAAALRAPPSPARGRRLRRGRRFDTLSPSCSRSTITRTTITTAIRWKGEISRTDQGHRITVEGPIETPPDGGVFCFMDYTKLNGLIPAVIQDAESSEVLMVGFMNEQALARTRESGFATFFSRHQEHDVDERRNLGQQAPGRRHPRRLRRRHRAGQGQAARVTATSATPARAPASRAHSHDTQTWHSEGVAAGRDDPAVRARRLQHLRQHPLLLSGDRRSRDRMHA